VALHGGHFEADPLILDPITDDGWAAKLGQDQAASSIHLLML
jgi:hypothetical protein